MMKWILMIMSFVLTRANSKQHGTSFAWEMYEEVVYKSRQVTMLALVGFAAAMLFCAGVLISLLNMTSQYDQTGVVAFTATLGMGVALLAIAGVGFAWVFVSAWPGVRSRKLQARKRMNEELRNQDQHAHAHQQPLGGGIEQAVSLWIMDLVKEREIRRAERADHRAHENAEDRATAEAMAKARRSTQQTTETNPLH